MATFAWSLIIVIRYAVIGGWTVSFCFFTFFSSIDDNCASITPNVDDIAEITVGVVEGVANLLAAFCYKATHHVSFLITYLL